MHIDYLDIGTSDFDIGDGLIRPNKQYLLVEPVVYYLNNIPNTPNVIKANFAVSNIESDVSVFYLEEDTIVKYGLPAWAKGCNKINSKHPTISKLLEERRLPPELVVEKLVKSITFRTLIELYGVTSITNLKIDTEGHDHIVLKSVFDYLSTTPMKIESIKVEYIPEFGNRHLIDEVALKLRSLFPVQQVIGNYDLWLGKK